MAGGFGSGVRFSASRSSSLRLACNLGAPEEFKKVSRIKSQDRRGHSVSSSRTWCISLHVSHLDEAVGCLLNVVVAVTEDVQEKILLDSWEDALQIPAKGEARYKSATF